MSKRPLIVLTGPTAVGKTALSIRLAKALDGEIISADSMQVYRGMDIGSAKVTKKEMDGVRHHLIDVLEPEEDFNVAAFQRMAKEALEEIYSRGKLPIVAGGTGFYIQALLYDIDFRDDTGEGPIRKELEKLAVEKGAEYLHSLLQQADPQSADQIHPNNIKRVVRALEYFRQTGEPFSLHNQRERERCSPYHFLYYVICSDRKNLYERIDRRVDAMMADGLVGEVQALKKRGVKRGMTSMQGLGYKEILDYLDGTCSLEEAVYVLKRDTRHFAKRQITWFRREREVRWLKLEDFGGDLDRVLQKILEDCREEGIGSPKL
ncbi:MAG: tRNA (adenosine(37)-N6)-dimethylallyltransferase MiaA [Lachnospiraceae bacterium]|uniref:tRNA dimethylallyltransferase n=1 Tax=Candidatus Enterocloster excrementigallinarum TaxID=2838558 RepID=A0A9D2PUM0_9FIRM|nr:tRNA (adenosine(37)-N6)-dimethylallyltransferase MiaA [Lachnospiraceae bacterium]HJC66066.1 tRNA (adenosine(37)-N6)-dimethylallyltransferase MiaA [Candidatus Enterocloster excrementigallinarum]